MMPEAGDPARWLAEKLSTCEEREEGLQGSGHNVNSLLTHPSPLTPPPTWYDEKERMFAMTTGVWL